MPKSQQTSENACMKSAKMPKKKLENVTRLAELGELAELLQIDCDDNLTVQEIRNKLQQTIKEQNKYLKTTTVCYRD